MIIDIITQELLARQVPYAHVKVDHRVLVVILRGELPRAPSRSMDSCEESLYRTFCSPAYCWNRSSLLRPNMKTVLSHLNAGDSDGAIVICLSFPSDNSSVNCLFRQITNLNRQHPIPTRVTMIAISAMIEVIRFRLPRTRIRLEQVVRTPQKPLSR